MAITYTELDRRTDTLHDLFDDDTTLGDGLREKPEVRKGPWEAGISTPMRYEVYVSRLGLPSFDYGMGGDPVIVTQAMAVAAVTSRVLDREEMEQEVGYLAANVMRTLLSNPQVTGTSGWHQGLITSTDAVRFRDSGNNLFEVEVFEFSIKFEVTP